MNRNLLLVAGTLVVVGGAVTFYVARGRSGGEAEHPGESEHPRSEVKQHQVLPTVKAMLDAPQGKTPCETAYLAATAEQERARSIGRGSMFGWIAPREQFLAKCGAFTPEQQRCMVPAYMASHRDDCMRIQPERAAIDALIKGSGEQMKEAEPALAPPPGSTTPGPGRAPDPG